MLNKFLESSDKVQNIVAAALAVIVATGVLHTIALNLMLPGSIYLITTTDIITMAITGAPITFCVAIVIVPIIIFNFNLKYRKILFIKITIVISILILAAIFVTYYKSDRMNTYLCTLFCFIFLALSSILNMVSDYKTINNKYNYEILLIMPICYFMAASSLFYVFLEIVASGNPFFYKTENYVCKDTCVKADVIASVGEFIVARQEDTNTLSYIRRAEVKNYFMVPPTSPPSEKPISPF